MKQHNFTYFPVRKLHHSLMGLLLVCTMSNATYLSRTVADGSALAEVLVVEVSSPTSLTACGESAVVSVMLSNTDPADALDNVIASINLPEGVSIQSVSTGATAVAGGFTLNGPLAAGDDVIIDLTIKADCDLTAASQSIEVTVSHDPVAGAMTNMVTENSSPVAFLVPDLVVTTSTPTSFAITCQGQTFSTTNTVANTSAGSVSTFNYCIQNSSVADITSVTVGGNSLSTAAMSPSGQTCFVVTETDLQNVLGGAFANNSITVTENWEVTTCGTGGTLRRRTSYGCAGQADCQQQAFSLAPTTALTVAVPDPILDLSISPSFGALLSTCGTGQTYTFTVTYDGPKPTLTNVLATINLPAGLYQSNLISATTGVVYSANSNEIQLPDLPRTAPGNTVSFTLDLAVDCGFVGVAGDFNFTVAHDPLCENSASDETSEDASFFVQSADLSIPLSTPNSIAPYVGLVTTVNTTVANAGNGTLNEVIYCIEEVDYATIVPSVAGIPLTPTTGQAGFQCFLLEEAHFMALFGTSVLPQNSNFVVEETYTFTSCGVGSQSIDRRVQFGCFGDMDCQDKPQGVFPATGVVFGAARPDINPTITSLYSPACYVDELTSVDVALKNTGSAPATEMVIRITSAGAIDLSNYSITDSFGNPIADQAVDQATVNAGHCTGGIRTVVDTIRNISLAAGASLTLHYDVVHSCDCNNCSIRDVYRSDFQVRSVKDGCGNYRNDGSSFNTGNFDAFLEGFVEGPLDLVDGAEATVEYTITAGQLDWFSKDQYTEAYLESIFTIQCGLDYQPGSVIWQDVDGTIWEACEEEYIDNNLGGDDYLRIRWCKTNADPALDRPGGFNIGSGMIFSLVLEADCGEKPPSPNCANPVYDILISQETFFTIDPSCASCPATKIFAPADLNMRVFCPDPGCVCDGLVFEDFSLGRTNFGLGDTNNDQIADGNVDLSLVQKDRYLQGDTLKATFSGQVSDPNNTDWNYGFAVLHFPADEDYIPLFATVEIVDADGTIHNCEVVPITYDLPNQNLIIDFSRDTLNALGGNLPANFDFDEDDTVNVCLTFKVKTPYTGQIRSREFSTSFYLSEAPYGLGNEDACNDWDARLYQVGLSVDSGSNIQGFGACEVSSFEFRYDRFVGSASFDEFPYEIRPLGLPEVFTFTKPAEFNYRLDDLGWRLRQQINPANDIVSLPNGVVPSSFVTVNGDELTFFAEAYFNSLNNNEIPPDEGYRAQFFVSLQGNCESIAADYDFSYSLTEAVDEAIYCTDQLARPTVASTFNYTGAARLVVLPETPDVRVCSGLDTINILVRNVESPRADNAFLYLNSPTGGVVIEEVLEYGTNNPLSGNNFGIYGIGTVNGNQTRRYRVVVRSNNCQPEDLDIVAGWDCESLPTTVEDATCSDPSTITFTSAMAGMNVDIISPVADFYGILCDQVPYEVEIRSTDLGYLRDIGMFIYLPPGQQYVSGSLELAIPSTTSGGSYVSVADPVPGGGGLFVNVSALDETLLNAGLIGSKDLTLTQNKISLRLLTETACSYLSGSRANFKLTGNSNCGDPLVPKIKPTARLRVTLQEPAFTADINLGDLSLNACNEEEANSFVSLTLNGGVPSMLDSIRYLLPPGIVYVPGSYQPILNAAANAPLIRTENGSQILVWPMGNVSIPGSNLSFRLRLAAVDVGQACTDYDLLVQAFSTSSETCSGQTCSVAVLAGEKTATLTIVKPSLTIDHLAASITLGATTDASAVFEARVCNNGATLQTGESVSMEIYEDTDLNGFRSAADVLLFTITDVLTNPLEFGQCITLGGETTFSSGSFCTIIAVLNTATTCTCDEVPSFQVQPEINIDFPLEVTVCSDEVISIGPDPIAGYAFEWLSVQGSSLGNLSTTMATPTEFIGTNITGMEQQVRYALRASFGNCYGLDTVTINLQSAQLETANITACIDESYQLPSLNIGGSNFQWVPNTGLSFPGPDSSFAIIDVVAPGLNTYTLTYQSEEGCPVTYIFNVTGINCGGAGSSLGDYIWFDFDLDGEQDPDEPGIEGVVVNLYNGVNGELIGSTTTDEDGFYLFDDLVQGNYFVGFVPLEGFVGAPNDQAGGNDELDSDADPTTGLTPADFLPWGTNNPTIDAGFIPDCYLEINATLSDCQPQGDDLMRALTIEVFWFNNPYTYDQFADTDTIIIDYYGNIERIVVDTVRGVTSFTRFIDASSVGVDITAEFAINPGCEASFTMPAFEECLFDLALTKTITNTVGLSYGDTVCFEITVFNQGEQAVSQVRVNDYLPAGFSFLPDLNPDWQAVNPTRLVTIVEDTIAVGGSLVVPLKARLNMASGADAWTNFAEIAAFQDTLGTDLSLFDEDSTPDNDPTNDAGGNPDSASDDSTNGNGTGTPGGNDPLTDEDDHDPAILEIFDLALTKTLVNPGPYAFGQTVTFQITVVNQGNVTAQNITINDTIPGGFVWLATNEPVWMFTGTEASTVLAGPILPGGSQNINISLQLQDAEADEFVNIAEITSAFDAGGNPRFDDIDSNTDDNSTNDAGGNPGTGSDDVVAGNGTGNPGDTDAATDEDDHDPAFVTIPEIALTKTAIGMVPAASGVPGNYDVTFQFVITNTGNEKLTMIQLTDNMISQLGSTFVNVVSAPILVPITNATENPTVNPGYNGGAIDNLLNGMDGCLAADQMITVQVVVELDSDTGLDPIINEASVSGLDKNFVTTTTGDTTLVAFPNCFLDVVCPATNGGTFDCVDELPIAASTVAAFNAIDQVSAIRNACGAVTITAVDTNNGGSGCIADPYVLTRTYTINDPGDGMSPAMQQTCVVTYTVIDDDAVALVCPGPLTTSCSLTDLAPYASLADFVAAGGLATDNCGISGFSLSAAVTSTTDCPEVTTRTYQVTDVCGNTSTCNQIITVDDTEPPMISCPEIATDCSLSDIPAYANLAEFLADGNTVSDNCGINAASFQLIQETTDGNTCPQIVVRKYQILDNCGNAAISQQIITIDDEIAPVFTTPAPADSLLDCDETIPAAVTLTATDNCDAAIVVDYTERTILTEVGACAVYSYQILRTWRAEDACGNVTIEEQLLTIQDNTSPDAVCCSDFTINIEADFDGIVTISPSDIDCGSTDNCTPVDELALSVDVNSLTCADLGNHTVTLTVTDDCGNSSNCSTVVTLADQTAPAITCPSPLVLECGNAANTDLIADWLSAATAEDGCTMNQTITTDYDFTNFTSCGNTGEQVVTFTATDDSSNSSNCTSTISIQDNLLPTIVCPAAMVTCDLASETPYTDLAAFVAAGGAASDNCQLDAASFTHLSDVTSENLVTRTYQISDVCGNTVSCQQLISVLEQPTVGTPEDIIISCSISNTGSVALSSLFVGATPGGTYTYRGGVGATIQAEALVYSQPGCYGVDYEFTSADAGICSPVAPVTAYVYVSEQPQPSFDLAEELCWDGSPTTLNALINSPSYTNTPTRSWRSTDTGIATVDNNGVVTIIDGGTVAICMEETITHTSCNGNTAEVCVEETCHTLIITEVSESVDASWTIFGPLCTDDAVVDLDVLVTGEANGVFTGSGVSGTHPNYIFTPSTGAGLYTITYTVSNGSGCTAVESHTVEVFGPVSAALNDLDLGCVTDPVGIIALSILFDEDTTPGGTFTGAGVTGNALTYTGPGCYEVTYTVSAFAGADLACTDEATAYILISEQPQPSFDIQDQVCWSDGDDPLTHVYNPVVNSPVYTDAVTRVFSVESGPATLLNATTGQIQVTGIGTVILRLTETITYEMCGTTPTGTCEEIYEIQIAVSDGTAQNASFTVSDLFPCLDEVVMLTPAEEGGQFTGTGVTDNGNGTGATFSFNALGTYAVTYTLNNPNGCSNVYTVNIMVQDLPAVITCPADVALTCDDPLPPAATNVTEFLALGGTVTDDCADAAMIANFAISVVDAGNGNSVCPDDGRKIVTRTYTITDLAGNQSVCQQLFNYAEDATPPLITTMAMDETVECDGNGNTMQLTDWLAANGGAVATDNGSCSTDLELVWTNELLQSIEMCGQTLTYIYRFTVSDLCGNTASTDASFVIEDTTDPLLTTEAQDLTITCADGDVITPELLEWLDANGYATATDDCSNLSWTNNLDLSSAAALCATGGSISVTFTVTDECGNASTTEADLIITQVSSLGVAKRVVSLINNPDGSATITYEFNVENFGTVDLDSLQVTDNLFETFPSPCAITNIIITSDDYLVNTNFNGLTDINLLLGSDVLQAEDKGAILLTITVGACGVNNGPFLNYAEADAVQGDGTHITDTSNWGVDPDPNGDGIPDEQSGTPVTFEEVASLGVAKALIFARTNPDGSYDVTYEFNIQNFGTVNFTGLLLQDNLRATFPETCEIEITTLTSDEFDTNNGIFDGINNIELLLGTDILEPGEEGSVNLSLHITNCGGNLGPFFNNATLSGVDPDGMTIVDASVDGTYPDPDGNNVPDESSSTMVNFEENPFLGVAKRVSEGPTLRADDYFEISYELRVQNLGDVNLEVRGVYDTLAQTFAGAADWMLLSVESEEFAINTGFDGLTDFNLISPSLLEPNEQGVIYLRVAVAPGGFPGPYLNTAFGNSISPFGTITNDFSQEGSDPDPTNDGDPTNDTEATPVTLDCFVGIICPAVTDTIIVDNDLGWCQAAVNFPPAEIVTCAGVPDSLIEFKLLGAGAMNTALDEWIAGQPSGLMYNVGLTEVLIRTSVPSLPMLGYSDTCSFFIRVNDKQVPAILCQDITVPVGGNCEYLLTPDRLNAGSTDNCTEPADLIYEISLDNVTYTDELTFGVDDLLMSPITVYLRVTDEYGNFSICTNEVNLVDDTAPQIICPEDRDIPAEENLCVGIIPNLMAEMTLDNCAPIDTVFQVPAAGLLFGTAHGDMITVVLTVVDINGNTDTCGVVLTLIDETPPTFLNCPAPNVVLTSLPGLCSNFANFSLPAAIDNCGIGIEVVQTDDTGLTSGDMFPVGTTILEFTATDPAGNSTVCTHKVIINDNDDPTPTIGDGCPADITVNVSPSECGAFVSNISPRFQDNCDENLATVYRLVDGMGNTITDGLANASGEFFMLGTTTVEYRAQDQPLLLITEMTHDLEATVGGTNPVPAFITSGTPDGDFLEITNFGPASMDVSCLGIERHHAGGSENIALPRFTVLAPGEVLTIHFGDGTDDQANGFFNLAGAANLSLGEGAAYVISHSGTVLDVAVLGNFNPVGLGTLATVTSSDWSGQVNGALSGAIRTFVWDTNTADDFVAAAVCGNTTIGNLNPQLPQPTDNGGLTSLQSQLPNTITCTFTVTVGDNEFPRCGAEGEALVYNNFNGGQFFAGDCVESTLLVTDFGLLADVNLHFTGTTNAFGNLDLSLISPNGTEIDLASAICGTAAGWDLTFDSDSIPSILSACNLLDIDEELSPVNSLEQFVGQAANGSWTLRLGHNGSLNQDPITFEGWSLELRLQTSYDQPDIIAANDPGECSALIEWRHPIFFDNCPNGTIQRMIVTEDGELLSNGQLAVSNWGALTTFNFPVGTTNVNYTLTDAAGNVTECGFQVTVNDEEPPLVNCPDDVVIQLGPGECEVAYTPLDLDVTDNCGEYTVVATPPFNTLLPIGETVVTVVITDAAGNPVVCTYTVTVVEYVPEDPTMACIEQINVSLGPDCTREITAEMVLTGNDYYCYDNYEVTLLDAPEGNPLITSPFVTDEHIGQTVVVMICDLVNDICCWGYVNVGFYEAPTFECPADMTLSCIELTTPEFTGEPVLLSCALGGADISYQDLVQENGTCADTILIIDRTWTVADASGNSTSCVQHIVVETFDLEDIVFPTDRDGVSLPALSCSAVAANPTLTHPNNTGYPTLNGSTEVFGVNNCSASYLYTDEIYNICAGSYEILRTWKVRNTCLPVVVGQNPREHIQLIRVLDQEDPQVICPDDLIISTSPLTCTAYYPIPAPLMMNDGCSNTSYTVSVSGGALTFVNGNYTLSNLAPGTYTITYRVRDECNRRTTCSYTVTVEDLIEPTAACDDLLQISLGGQGIARITAADLDEGSYDACGPVSLAIRRAYTRDPEDCSEVTDYFSPWDEEQYFSCCDLNETVRLELLVTDLQGNTNSCWLDVLVEDKIAPYCDAPANQTVTCAQWPLLFSGDLEDAYANDFAATSLTMNELFGGPTGIDNCTVDTLVERAPNIQINDCGWGTITRRFAAWQWNGDTNGNGAIDINEVLSSVNNCTQIITIEEVHDYAISFPADGDAACTDGEVSWDEIATFADGCDVLVVNIGEPDVFPATADECYKLRIPYTIINWCVWDGEVTPINLSRDEDNDDQPGEAFWVYRRAGNNLAVIDTDNDETNGFIREVVDRGHWKYYQFVKVYDNTAPVIEDSGALEFCATPTCDTLVTLSLSITDDCGLNGLQIISVAADNNAVDVNGNGTIESNEFFADMMVTNQAVYDGSGGLTYSGIHPIGVHALRVVLTDGCGNTVSHYTTFRVNDCAATAPICINGLTVTLMPTAEGDCAAAIWVTDYLGSPVDDCSSPLQYAIYRATEVEAAGEDFVPDPARNGLVLTTADEATTVLYIYAIDTAGNFEYCETYVLVQAGSSDCSNGENATIAGVIMTEDAEAVAEVEVSLSGGNTATMTTGDDGAYTFANLQASQDYSVTPYSNANPLNGVSTFDIILMSKHILAVQPLNSPYKRIAADVNRSGTITTLDMIQLRKLILNITTEFPNNTSWRFVDQDYVFPEPTNPWLEAFPELINVNNISTIINDADFVAVKIGDVNGSAQANALSSDDRTLEESLQLEIENADLRQGNVYTIAVTAGNAAGMNGFQGTLQLSGLELLTIEHTLTTAANFGLQATENGLVTMSWDQAPGDPSLSATDVLFSLVVRALADQRLSEGLEISSRYTVAEAYRANALHELGLQFVESAWPRSEFALYQNTPNPFDAESVIGFYLPEDLEATLTIHDVGGRVILLLKKDYRAGYHDFVLTRQQLQGYTGVLTYTLRAGDYQASKTMVVVK